VCAGGLATREGAVERQPDLIGPRVVLAARGECFGHAIATLEQPF